MKIFLSLSALLSAALFPGSSLGQVVISGTVTDESKRPIPAATIQLEGQRPGSVMETVSNEDGAFYLNLDQAGQSLLTVRCPGFYEIKQRPLDFVTGTNIVAVELISKESASFSVDVYPEKNLTVEHIASSQTLVEEEILAIPANRSNFLQNMMAVLPGAVKDQKGQLHFYGSPSEEINWMLDGFSVADPSSGLFELGMSVEAVKSFDLFSGRYSVEFGKGSGGTMLINTPMGDNKFLFHATNFVPAIENNKGLRVDSWRPRYTVSGPIIKNRLWFFDGFDLNFKQNVIPELPRGQDRTLNWAPSNLLRVQANITPTHILNFGFLMNYLNAPKFGLSALDPVETTLDKRSRRYFFDVKDQIYLPSKIILEVGYGAYRSINRELPQGQDLYQITAYGHRGNFPINTHRLGKRDQWLARAFLPAFSGVGNHQLKIGLDLNYSRYFQDINRTGYEYFRVDGSRAYQVVYGGNGVFGESNLEAAIFLQDRWAIRSWLVAEAGIRLDWDRILSETAVTPRFSFALMPPWLKNTKISAGLGLIPSATYLRLFTRDMDQYSVSTHFGRDGQTSVGVPSITALTINREHLKIPITKNFSVGLEQQLPANFYLRTNYLRRRGNDGYRFFPTSNVLGVPSGPAGIERAETNYDLQNSKQEVYDSIELALSNQFFNKYEWFASYARSRAFSNAAMSVNVDDPVIFTDTAGPPPWDVPNRLVSWGIFPVTKNNSVVYFFEWRDGFPFSVHDDEAGQVGAINSWRFPRYLSLNVHVERKLRLFDRQLALRLGFDNLTNRPNYILVNNNISSPDFLHLYGREPRKFVVRIRWLGKARK